MDNQEVDPEKAPSGAKATGFGEILSRVWITGEDGDRIHTEVMILADPEMPQIFLEAAAHHILAAAALGTDLEFNEAIDSIARDAKTAHSRLYRKRPMEDDPSAPD